MELPFAEDINYFKTSNTSPDIWMEKSKVLIESFGGNVIQELYGSIIRGSGFMIIFEYAGEQYKIMYPVLPTRNPNKRAAIIQAATLMYHDIKAKLLNAKIFGIRAAFFQYLLQANGQSVLAITSGRQETP